eukprot:5532885-Pyramimonas_sp.AAC.1
MRALQKQARPLFEADRVAYLDSLAMKADRAMASNDSRTAFAVARSLSGAPHKLNSSVCKLDG